MPATSSPETRNTALTSMRHPAWSWATTSARCGRHRRRAEQRRHLCRFLWLGATIGGTTTGDANVISGNTSYGVDIDASSCLVEGNEIGSNAAGKHCRRQRNRHLRILQCGRCDDRWDRDRRRQRYLRKSGIRRCHLYVCVVPGRRQRNRDQWRGERRRSQWHWHLFL